MRDLATQQILEEQYGRPAFLQAVTLTAAGSSYRSAAIPAGSRLLIQPSVATTMKVGDSTVTAAATECVGLIASEKFYTCLTMNDTHIAFFPSGTGIVNIFLME